MGQGHEQVHDHAHGKPMAEGATANQGGPGNAAMQEQRGLGSPRPGAEEGFKHTVERGDTFWQLAEDYLGSGPRWREIYALNKEEIGGDPNLIHPGQVFVIPTTPVSPDTSTGPVVEEAAEEAGPSASDLPTAGDTGELCVPYVVLARGAGATEASAGTRRGEVKTLVESWGQTFAASSVVLAAEETSSGRQPVVSLIWDDTWGDLPTNTEVLTGLRPVDAELGLTTLKTTDGWDEVEAGTQGQLEALIGGETNDLSAAARTELERLTSDGGWSGTSAEDQAKALEGLFSSDKAKPELVDEPVASLTPEGPPVPGRPRARTT